jgi:lysine-N-methylase
VTLPIRTLPIVEHWDCHGCGVCCRGTTFTLSEDDIRKLREQRWEEHPEFHGVPILARLGLLRRGFRLAKRPDGCCVFLTAAGRCRIHEEFGFDAKPLVCRMFPFQLVPLEQFAYLTLRRYCPSAAADRGPPLEEHLAAARQLAEEGGLAAQPAQPPPLVPGRRRAWSDFWRAAEAIQRLMLDPRWPPVRRVVHTLRFCELMEQCRLGELDGERLQSLVTTLEAAAVEGSDQHFRERRPPGRAGAMLFRQAALEYLRLHPKFVIRQSWAERWRLMWAAAGFARGKGRVPRMHPCFPETTFEALQRPLGHLAAEVLQPFHLYLETQVASLRFAAAGRVDWSLTESFRALAFSYAIAMWLLRLSCGERPPQVEDMIDVVGAIDRGHSFAALSGRRHRRRLASLRRLGELPRLVVWYAR